MESLPYQEPEFISAWKEWVDYRKEIKKPYKSQKSANIQLREIRSWSLTVEEAIESINNSILHGWTAIFPKKKISNGTSRKQTIGDSFNTTDAAFANLQGRIDSAMCQGDTN